MVTPEHGPHFDRTRRWAIAHPRLGFPLIYLGWAYLFWLPVLLSDESVWTLPGLVWFLLGGASPLLAGLGLAALTGGKRQVADLARRLLDWRRISWRWWLIILFFWLGFDLAMAGIAFWLGIAESPLDVNGSLFFQPGPLVAWKKA
ncbi:hypothetical protein LPB19_16190 [Marinobacter salinisoli]|uniref:Uncharacterized protein n=1 Tax=Marinobacter salinisoli TaxID=2769486 RepID=A0ABX7MQX6_9GAMM|nr:hypothetical protein [Marinobacter salinisoli]QSP94689.1 hypothetical protein LPB19_16190 [Marinobacter salinisoli]